MPERRRTRKRNKTADAPSTAEPSAASVGRSSGAAAETSSDGNVPGATTTQFALEERLAFLERHIQQQDREIYAQSEQIRRLQLTMQQLRGQVDAVKAGQGEPGGVDFPGDERPPHY